jgi:mRNA-degrading endonuclease toxin of MazEF toxin-antitoxin module
VIVSGQALTDQDQSLDIKQFLKNQLGRTVSLQDLNRICQQLQISQDANAFYSHCCGSK